MHASVCGVVVEIPLWLDRIPEPWPMIWVGDSAWWVV